MVLRLLFLTFFTPFLWGVASAGHLSECILQLDENRPKGRSVHSVAATLEGQGRILYESKETGIRDIFETGDLHSLLKVAPQFARRLGIRRLMEGYFTHPNAAALNHRLQKLGLTVRFWEGPPHEASIQEYIEHWARGEIVLAVGGREHYHDLFVHGLGFALLPRILVESSIQYAQFSTRIRQSGLLASNPELELALNRFDQKFVEIIDRASGEISNQLFRSLIEGDPFRLGMAQGRMLDFVRFDGIHSPKQLAQILLTGRGLPNNDYQEVFGIAPKTVSAHLTPEARQFIFELEVELSAEIPSYDQVSHDFQALLRRLEIMREE